MVAGVIAGLANFAGIDVTLARVIYVVGSALSAAFPGVLVYILLWMVIPEGE
jgi:phage shock protein PspC (stress-responsive transcriptional regulator)